MLLHQPSPLHIAKHPPVDVSIAHLRCLPWHWEACTTVHRLIQTLHIRRTVVNGKTKYWSTKKID